MKPWSKVSDSHRCCVVQSKKAWITEICTQVRYLRKELTELRQATFLREQQERRSSEAAAEAASFDSALMGSASKDVNLVNSRTRLELAMMAHQEHWEDRPADAKYREARRLTRKVAKRARTKVPSCMVLALRLMCSVGPSHSIGPARMDANPEQTARTNCCTAHSKPRRKT